ncbi:hypothetical protein FocTR4_00013524 [Fusarium oxysporum f. sp. cubense]|nr:hypothetical protein FocTR4_00013524 [Fusarium oxysporum f. sp. cubense]
MHPGTYPLYPLRPQVMAQPEGNQWLRPFSNAMEQQHGLIPPSSVCVDPAVLQSTTAAPGGVMKGQGQHDQGYQQSRPFVPTPSGLSAAPESPSASVGRAEHRARKTRGSSAVLGHRRSRPNHGHLQTMSTWRFQGHWRTQPQGGSSGYFPKQGISRAIVPHRCGLPRNAAAQTGDGETSGHIQRLRRPLEQRMPLALRPQLPSIRLLFPEIFASKTEASTAHRSLHGTRGNDFGVVQPRQ